MKVIIRLHKTSQPIIFDDVENTYQKGDLFCIYIKKDNEVTKYPIINIHDIRETYKDREFYIKE